MAQIRETAPGGKWFTSGEDHGKPVRYKIRPVPEDVDTRLERESYRGAKLRKVQQQAAMRAIERARDYGLRRAGYALVDTENFSVEIGSEPSAELFGRLLGEKLQVGSEVLLDGRWTDELRTTVLRLARKRAIWISNKADELREADIEDEEEEAADF